MLDNGEKVGSAGAEVELLSERSCFPPHDLLYRSCIFADYIVRWRASPLLAEVREGCLGALMSLFPARASGPV